MKAQQFYSQVSRPKIRRVNPGGGVKLVETQGYIPLSAQVIRLIDAGQRLEQMRSGAYDFSEDQKIDDTVFDDFRPIQIKSMSKCDILDAQRIIQDRFKRNREKREALLKKQQEEQDKKLKERLKDLEDYEKTKQDVSNFQKKEKDKEES